MSRLESFFFKVLSEANTKGFLFSGDLVYIIECSLIGTVTWYIWDEVRDL